MRIVRAELADLDVIARLRHALWPHNSIALMASDARENYFSPQSRGVIFLARTDAGETVGHAEATLRHDFVNGCDTSPVAFLEGIYVAPDHRRQGIARALVEAVQQWGRAMACSEFASDALIEHEASHAFHKAIGFAETKRVVYFRKLLERSPA